MGRLHTPQSGVSYWNILGVDTSPFNNLSLRLLYHPSHPKKKKNSSSACPLGPFLTNNHRVPICDSSLRSQYQEPPFQTSLNKAGNVTFRLITEKGLWRWKNVHPLFIFKKEAETLPKSRHHSEMLPLFGWRVSGVNFQSWLLSNLPCCWGGLTQRRPWELLKALA